jgi:hypothetical protein
MTNEFKSLTDEMVLELYEKAVIAHRQSPRIMPYNDREYLLRRRVRLRSELVRRRIFLP